MVQVSEVDRVVMEVQLKLQAVLFMPKVIVMLPILVTEAGKGMVIPGQVRQPQ